MNVCYSAYMTSSSSTWSVFSWFRYDEEPPPLLQGLVSYRDKELELHEKLDPAWIEKHRRRGAQIHDSKRGVTYRATLDLQTYEMDYLEVVVDGPFTRPNGEGYKSFERLRSIPLSRIHSAVRKQVIEELRAEKGAEGPVLIFTPEGGLVEDGDGSMRKPPSSEEIAMLMRPIKEGGRALDRNGVAAHYGRAVRTVDGWISRARKELPEKMPPKRGQKPLKTPEV